MWNAFDRFAIGVLSAVGIGGGTCTIVYTVHDFWWYILWLFTRH